MLRVVSLISSFLILLFGVIGIVLDAALAIENALRNGPHQVPLSTFPMGTFVGIPFLVLGGFLLFAGRVKPADPPPSQSADPNEPLPCESPTPVENGGLSEERVDRSTSNPVRLALWVMTCAAAGLFLGMVASAIAGRWVSLQREPHPWDDGHNLWLDAMPLVCAFVAAPFGLLIELYCQKLDASKPL